MCDGPTAHLQKSSNTVFREDTVFLLPSIHTLRAQLNTGIQAGTASFLRTGFIHQNLPWAIPLLSVLSVQQIQRTKIL